MGPTGTINLTGGNAHGTQSRHREGALLATTANAIAHGGQRSRRASVARPIAHLLVAPVVHLQGGLLHGEALEARSQLLIDDFARIVQRLVVHSHRKYEMFKLPSRNATAPRHLRTGLQRHAHLLLPVGLGIINAVGGRHVLIKESKALGLSLRRQGQAHCRKNESGQHGSFHRWFLIFVKITMIWPIIQIFL